VKKWYNEELHILNFPSNIIKIIKLSEMRREGSVVILRVMEDSYKILI
jgi:hypothetical protein